MSPPDMPPDGLEGPDDRIDGLWDEVQALRLSIMAIAEALARHHPAAAEIVPELIDQRVAALRADLPDLEVVTQISANFSRVLKDVIARSRPTQGGMPSRRAP